MSLASSHSGEENNSALKDDVSMRVRNQALAHLLPFQLCQLDSDEFELPPVDHIPTLEEILNEVLSYFKKCSILSPIPTLQSNEDRSFLESDEAIGPEISRFEQRSESDLSSITGSVNRDYSDRMINDW